jgi:hypothetical protein
MTATRSISVTSRNCPNDWSSSGPPSQIPALLTRMSSRPCEDDTLSRTATRPASVASRDQARADLLFQRVERIAATPRNHYIGTRAAQHTGESLAQARGCASHQRTKIGRCPIRSQLPVLERHRHTHLLDMRVVYLAAAESQSIAHRMVRRTSMLSSRGLRSTQTPCVLHGVGAGTRRSPKRRRRRDVLTHLQAPGPTTAQENHSQPGQSHSGPSTFVRVLS